MADLERMGLGTALEAIVAEASAFSEYNEGTDDAFRRIVRLAKRAQEEHNSLEQAAITLNAKVSDLSGGE